MIWLILIFVLYIVCGVLAYGMTLYDFETEFPAIGGHRSFAFFIAFAGPVGLFVALVMATHYGLMFKPLTKEQAWEAHQREFPHWEQMPDFQRALFERFYKG